MRIIKVNIIPTNRIKVDLIPSSTPIFILGGEKDYNKLENLPTLNGNVIAGNKMSEDYGIENAEALSNLEIEEILSNFI